MHASFWRLPSATPGWQPSGAEPEQPTPTRPAVEGPEPEVFAGGRYRVQRALGEGAKKRVYLAHDELLDRDVALALIKTEGLDDVGRERVVREAQAMGRLGTHPHLVAVLDFGQEASSDGQPTPFIITEYMSGGSVEELLASGPLGAAQALEVASGVARGLAFAHDQGVVHRDLKPGNVWLTCRRQSPRSATSGSPSRSTSRGSPSTG